MNRILLKITEEIVNPVTGKKHWFFRCDLGAHYKKFRMCKNLEQELPMVLEKATDFLMEKLEKNYKYKWE